MPNNSRKTILLSIPNWRSAASILRTEILSLLRKEGFKIIILSPFSKIGDFVNEIKDNRIIFEKSKFKNIPSFIRDGILFLNFVTNSFLTESFNCFVIRMNEYFNRFFKEKKYTSSRLVSVFLAIALVIVVIIISCIWIILTPFFKTNILKKSSFKNSLDTFVNICYDLINKNYTASIFTRYKPDLVCVSRLVFCPEEYSIVGMCKIMKISTVGVCTHLDAWTYPISDFACNLVPVDKLLVWSSTLREEIVNAHNYEFDNIIVTGCSEHDMFFNFSHNLEPLSRERFFKKLGLDVKRKLLIFTVPSSPRNHNEFVSYLYELIQYLVYCVSEDKLISPCQLIIRIHPTTTFKSQLSLRNDFGDKRHIFILPSGKSVEENFKLVDTNVNNNSQEYFAELLTYADALIACRSGVIVDAAIFDTPIISIPWPNLLFQDITLMNKLYEELLRHKYLGGRLDIYDKYVTSNIGVSMVYNKGKIIDYINSYLDDHSLGSPGRRELIKKLCGQIDGNASRRIVEALKSMLK